MRRRRVRALVLIVAALHLACTGADAAGRPTSAVGKGEAPFVQVLHHEREVQAEVNEAFRAWAMPQRLAFPMDPDHRVRVATGVQAGAAAIRGLSGGEREVIGWALFTAGRPDSYEHFSARRAFRMVLGRDGKARRVSVEGRRLDESGIVKPVFAAVDDAEARALQRRLQRFLHEPAQSSWLDGYLWAAIAGEPTTHTYELHGVRATQGSFGAFGRIVRFRGTLLSDGRPVPGYTDFEIEVVLDRTGRVIAAGDPTW